VIIQDIDKARYRKHLNFTILGCIVALLVSSLSLSTLFIALISQPDAQNFTLNLMAVVVSVAAILTGLSLNKKHPFFYEVYYVWRLKMELNFINAKIHKIEAASPEQDRTALTILCFYYQASRQLWTLDDNTISLDSLDIKQAKLLTRLDALTSPIDSKGYHRELLKQF